MKTKLVTVLLLAMFTLGLISVIVPPVNCTASVFVTFKTTGLYKCAGGLLIIDNEPYLWNADDSEKFEWAIGSTHSVQAVTSVENYDTPSMRYIFSSWTNGNGLVDSSGTFLVPSQDLTVTANYEPSTVKVQFRYSGLMNLNTPTVITVDGNEYQYNSWELKTRIFSMEIGSTHTVAASTPLTGWDGVTHYFLGWTNGYGLTGTSGTFIVPSSDVTVIANYGLSPVLETAMTISCTLDSVNGGTAVIISGGLSSGGSGIADKTIALTYYDGANWHSIGSTATSSAGTYSYNWIVPEDLENGVYPVKAEFQGDAEYLSSSAVTGNAGSLMVVPEFPLGGLVALLACFSSAFIFIKLRSKGIASFNSV